MTTLPTSMQREIARVITSLPQFPQLPKTFANTLSNTFTTTLRPQADGSTFVITGDIPAMWLRDSAAQVRPYLRLAKHDPQFTTLIAGVIKRQCTDILRDPYANAFNETANGYCHNRDKTDMSAWIWERKYELDSLCAPLTLAYDLWRETQTTTHLDQIFWRAAKRVIDTITVEQRHDNSPYTFERLEGPFSDTLTNDGRGAATAYTGLSWSGFRPSDDACQYNYLIPSNMMASVALQNLASLPGANATGEEAKALATTIRKAIERHGKAWHPHHGTIYAYETDGLGHYNLMDDANVPSLLAMPYMGYCAKDDATYLNTRNFVLSKNNPFFYEGSSAKGVGSPHTPPDHIWPIALCMQGLTSNTREEQLDLLNTLLTTDATTDLMHESFHKDEATKFTRPWFAWANSLFAEFVMTLCD